VFINSLRFSSDPHTQCILVSDPSHGHFHTTQFIILYDNSQHSSPRTLHVTAGSTALAAFLIFYTLRAKRFSSIYFS